jgi:hypothetical protein
VVWILHFMIVDGDGKRHVKRRVTVTYTATAMVWINKCGDKETAFKFLISGFGFRVKITHLG